MGKKNNWGTRNRRKAATASAGEMSTKLNIHTFCNPRKGRCGAAFRGFCFAVKEVLCGIYKPVFWRKNGLFVPNWITFGAKRSKKEDYRTMKNLKKVLSLVLALAMALSLMTAAFAAVARD